MPLEKAFGKTEGLRTCEKQFFGLLDFFLSLRVELIHSGFLQKNGRRIVAMRARVSNQAPHSLHIVFRNPQDSEAPNLKAAAWGLQRRNLEI
jgi:hypothetical protein